MTWIHAFEIFCYALSVVLIWDMVRLRNPMSSDFSNDASFNKDACIKRGETFPPFIQSFKVEFLTCDYSI